ncbi:unnamed protein product [Ceutorhynchus assimilis]|uniref:Uncharacterized protein n=1 Tax=Ceutorhynchus assimilis TaxID=467358 RepID=A0A9N9QEJ1_9CUCU|nr:unnamed protein product [Ceutorhynchus assimilis]
MRLLLFFGFCVVHVSTTGLNEEFSWSRITYEWPEDGTLSSRFGRRSVIPLYTQNRPHLNADPIVFEGSTNADVNRQTKRKENQNNDNNNEADNVPESMDYQYVNNIPMGANVWQDKLFITIPRRRLGVPSTLNYVPLKNAKKHNVPLKPYPNWEMNLYPDTSDSKENFVSVYRTAIDVCDRMWFVDTGIVETLGNRTTVKPHQIVIINLNTDKVIHRFNLPDSVITPNTILASLNIDSPKGSCGDAYAYFPDLSGYGLIVYSLRENRAWRVAHNYFYLEPMAGDFFIAQHNFQWNDGIFSVELSDLKANGYRDMYFHAMAGTHVYKVSTRILRNETLATRSYHGDDFVVVGDKGPKSQTSTADIHKPTGTMFMALVNQNALGCWNINKDLKTLSIVQKDDQRMIYPSDVRVSQDKVYVLTNTMPEFLYGRLNYDETNFRVWSSDVRSAIQGTMCQGGRSA